MLLQVNRYQKDISNNVHPIKCFNYWGVTISAKINRNICNSLIKIINSLMIILYSLCDKKKKILKIGVYGLTSKIVKKLNKQYPNLDIIKSKKTSNIYYDIFIPELNMGFIFKEIYNDNGIKQEILNKIKTCKSNNINLYVFDTIEMGKIDKYAAQILTYEIAGQIEKQIFLNNSFLMNNFK